MTTKDEVINRVHGLLRRMLNRLGIKEVNLMDYDEISFPFEGWDIELKIDAKKNEAIQRKKK